MADGYPVYLYRLVGAAAREGIEARQYELIRAVRLPVPPFVGLGLCLDGNDPYKIDHVYVGYFGAVICCLEDVWYRPDELNDEREIDSQMRFHAKGWLVLDGGRGAPQYYLPPAPDDAPLFRDRAVGKKEASGLDEITKPFPSSPPASEDPPTGPR